MLGSSWASRATALAVTVLFFASLLAFATHASFDNNTSLGADTGGVPGSALSTTTGDDATADATAAETPTSR